MPEQDLDSMSYEEIALDWVQRVVALSPIIDKYVISSEGILLHDQARTRHQARYSEFPTDEDAEMERRKQELADELKGITNNDPGVVEKNKFLALLLSRIDGTHQLDAILNGDLTDIAEHEIKRAITDEKIANGEEVDEDVVDAIVSGAVVVDPEIEDIEVEEAEESDENSRDGSDVFDALAQMQADHTINTIVSLWSLRRYADSVYNNDMIYINQFLGLFGIYNAGKAAVQDQE